MKTHIRSDLKEVFANSIFVFIALAILSAISLLMSKTAFAKSVYYSSQPEQVRIQYGSPTVFRFPKSVQTVTGASRLLVEPINKGDYSSLSITPRFTNGIHEVTFFLVDRSVVRAKILVNPKDPAAETFYDFKSRESGNGDTENSSVISEVELLKAMVRDGEVSGYKVHHVSQSFPSKGANTRAELIRIYKGSPFNGYVFKVTNTSWKKALNVDVRHISVGEPNLAILSQSDEMVLSPKGKGAHETLIRVVAKNTAASNDVVLAMESEEAEPKNMKGE